MNLTPGNIYNGDCLELMHGIPDGSIDMILADLPYGTTACHWDSIIPLEPLWAHYKRIIKPRGAIVLTGSQPFTSVLVMSNLEWFKYEWVWDKVNVTGFLDAKRKPLKRHENIVVFSSGQTQYNPILSGVATKSFGRRRKGTSKIETYAGNFGEHHEQGVGYPQSIVEFQRPNNITDPSFGLHPTQKPTSLFSYLIRTYTNPGELVLDNTAGSGTTAIAAIDTGRDWICIEKDASYFQIAQERIREKLAQPFLPGIAEGQPVKVEQVKLFRD